MTIPAGSSPRQDTRTRLPRRPWLRRDVPLMWRSDNLFQIGLDPQRLVVLDVDRTLIAWARGLGGDRTLEAALAQANEQGIQEHDALELLWALLAAGAMSDADHVPTCVRALTPQERDVAHRHEAAARQTYRDDRAHLAVDARASAYISVVGSGLLADALRHMLQANGIGKVTAETPPSSAARKGRHRADESTLIMLADSWHPDVVDDNACGGLDVAHMPVGAWGNRAVVGPLVLPGRSACLRCLTLHSRDRDADWPRLAMQVAHMQPDAQAQDTALVAAAAAHAAALACAYVEAIAVGHSGRDWAGVSRVIELPGGQVHTRAHPVHPMCGCRWPSTVSD